jgi:hypothetical protein
MSLHIPRRIAQGIESGELTRGEARELRQDRREIRQARQEARSDGQITAEEKQAIREQVREMSRDVFALKHNDQKRGT